MLYRLLFVPTVDSLEAFELVLNLCLVDRFQSENLRWSGNDLCGLWTGTEKFHFFHQ